MHSQLPNNVQAETSLLSSIFIKNDILADVIGILKPTDFYNASNQVIFKKMLELFIKNIPLDIITISNSLDSELLKSIGGITYLSQIAGASYTTVNYKEYCKIIKELSNKRSIIKSCELALSKIQDAEVKSKEIISSLESSFLKLSKEDEEGTINSLKLMEDTLNFIEEGYKLEGKIRGITTGYKPLDNATNGFIKGDLFIIAARPSMGKTALVMNILNKIPKENNAVLYELEMTKQKIGVRMLAPKTLLNSKDLARGNIKDSDFVSLIEKADSIAEKDNIYINTKSDLSIGEIMADAKKIKLKHGLDLLFIDHLGKIKADNPKATKYEQIGQVSQGLKNIAKELDVCVIALSQLSRECERRNDKHPILSDIRDSGNVEQDGDEIIFLFRDDYYAEKEGRESKNPGILELMVAKNRDGECGRIDLRYNTACQLIK